MGEPMVPVELGDITPERLRELSELLFALAERMDNGGASGNLPLHYFRIDNLVNKNPELVGYQQVLAFGYGEPKPDWGWVRERRCSCDSPGGPIPHRPACELNHPNHPCEERSCSFAPRMWTVTASSDGAFVGFRYRWHDGAWEVQHLDGAWGPSSYTGPDDMRAAGFTLAETSGTEAASQ